MACPSKPVRSCGKRWMTFWRAPQTPHYPIRFIRPTDSLPQLQSSLSSIHAEQPLSAIVDLTRGALGARLALSEALPTVADFSISRIRQADRPGLPTTGHLLSHNSEDLRDTFKTIDTDHLLVLDDTSFSGTTSMIVEQQLRQALPERAIQFTHGFLILNEGRLGESQGAKQRLQQLGSRAIGGIHMQTPSDDGWHFFDLIDQVNFDAHIDAVMPMLHMPHRIVETNDLQRLFPNMLTSEQLIDAQKIGRFVAQTQISGELHVRNPQLLPNIIGQNHLLSPEHWQSDEETTINHLKTMHELLKGDSHA